MEIVIEIFTVKYLEFIFTDIWHFMGFIIILLIITRGLGKAWEYIKNWYEKVRGVMKRNKNVEDFAENIKNKKPAGL